MPEAMGDNIDSFLAPSMLLRDQSKFHTEQLIDGQAKSLLRLYNGIDLSLDFGSQALLKEHLKEQGGELFFEPVSSSRPKQGSPIMAKCSQGLDLSLRDLASKKNKASSQARLRQVT